MYNIYKRIFYEDKDLLILNKPSNLVIHHGIKNNENTLLDILIDMYPYLKFVKNNGIVHRLDKNTTGLMIICKNNYSFYKLKEDFFKKRIIKKYLSIVTGEIFFSGLIDKPILRNKKNITKFCINKLGKKSITYYEVIEKLHLHTFIRIKPITGRTHQIRLHMSSINNSVLGDFKYKNNSSNYKKSFYFLKKNNINFNKQALHSYKLLFNHPVNKKKINIKLKCSKYIINLINNIKKNS